MLENCKDVFKKYDLPFETYFSKCIEHENESHDELELIWLVKGSATIICENKEYHLTNQNVFMVYMHREHAVKTTEDAIVISFRFKKEHLLMNDLHFEQIPFEDKVYSFKELSDKYHQVPLLIIQILRLLISPSLSQITRYKIIGYYNLFLYELYNFLLKEKYLDVKNRNFDPYLIRINALIEYISEHMHERISLDKLSKLVNISTFRLSHFFKESLGISFSEFLQNTRFEYALKILKETDLSICDVAKSSGFSDVKYLNQMLKTRFKMTALKYRKHIKLHCNQKVTIDPTTEFIRELNLCLKEVEKDHKFSDTYGLIQNMVKL